MFSYQTKQKERTRTNIQPKLRIGQPGDKYEQEADAVADRVMKMNQTETMQMQPIEEEEEVMQPKLRMQPNEEEEEPIQMKCAECEKEEEMLQPKSDEGSVATPTIEKQIHSSNGNGINLPDSTNQFMSSAMGADFSGVKIHTGSNAVQMNRQLQARAFTYGSNIYFNSGEYNPESSGGKSLLAHELTHVVQQGSANKFNAGSSIHKKLKLQRKYQFTGKNKIQRRGLNNSVDEEIQMKPLSVQNKSENTIQRDLATPLPAVAAAAQPDLTDAQIQEAIRFNRNRYNTVSTRLIQEILGGPVTGSWTEDNITAIAATQEQYGLTKDGKVGADTFRFIDTEISNEGLAKTDANCLVSFHINRDRENIVPRNNGARMTRHFTMNAQFPDYCDCSDFEYRQFIRGHFNHERAGVVTDEGDWFANLPAGRLNAAWQEDGHTGVPSVNFGYRSRAASPDDLYLNDAGAQDRANGCIYRGDDTPGGNYGGRNVANPTTGDSLDILVQFRGEIQRNGRVVRTKEWTALQSRFTLPA